MRRLRFYTLHRWMYTRCIVLPSSYYTALIDRLFSAPDSRFPSCSSLPARSADLDGRLLARLGIGVVVARSSTVALARVRGSVGNQDVEGGQPSLEGAAVVSESVVDLEDEDTEELDPYQPACSMESKLGADAEYSRGRRGSIQHQWFRYRGCVMSASAAVNVRHPVPVLRTDLTSHRR